MTISRPAPSEHLPYYSEYTNRVHGDWFEFQDQTHAEFKAVLSPLREAQAEVRPGPNEWNIKEVIGHIVDGERVFAYRALRIARKDTTPLASFDQDLYVPAGEFTSRPLADLLQEFTTVRAATLSLFSTFSEDALLRIGTASDAPVSVRALAYIIAGHEHHHLASLKTVYLGR